MTTENVITATDVIGSFEMIKQIKTPLVDEIVIAAYKSIVESLIAINKNLQEQNDFLIKTDGKNWNDINCAPIGVVAIFYCPRTDAYHIAEKQDTGEIFAIDMGVWIDADNFSHWMPINKPSPSKGWNHE